MKLKRTTTNVKLQQTWKRVKRQNITKENTQFTT
jgi:hypothetical protein